MLRSLVAVVLAVLLSVAATPSALAQPVPPSVVFVGSVPTRGGMALVSVEGETRAGELVAALRGAGCEPTLIAITTGGRFQIYAPGAPAFANASFPSLLVAGRSAAVRCAPPEVPDARLLRLVSKEHALPRDFVPGSLVALRPDLVLAGSGSAFLTSEAADALGEMLEAARRAGHDLVVRSAYRSYQEQVVTHAHWTRVLGEAEANRRSAPPGHSEHQLGTVVDLTSAAVGWDLVPEFGTTPEGQWLRRRAHEFGFVQSYPEDAEEITGYRYEPWHLRYIGTLHADWLQHTGLTLIEYLERVHGTD